MVRSWAFAPATEQMRARRIVASFMGMLVVARRLATPQFACLSPRPLLAGLPLFCGGPELDLLGSRRAELELRDLAERIERRIGQQVRGRFGVAERHENHVLGHVAVGAHLDLDRTAPGLQADEV